MAFKSVDEYNNERYKGMFILQNDGDYADVIFMYRDKRDVLVADTHYIRSADYNGYVHCCGRNCPACEKNIRVQPKLFIPMYVLSEGKVLFFDRSIRFDAQLQNDVFARYPNPSEYIFRITRHGKSRDVNTTYEIVVQGRNNVLSYDDILKKLDIKMPDYFDTVCKEFSPEELYSMLNTKSEPSSANYSEMPEYQISARKTLDSAQDDKEEKVPLIPDDIANDNDLDDLDDNVDF